MIPRTETSTNRLLSRVRALVERGERIAESDAAALFSVSDATGLARIARVPRERRWGVSAFYSDALRIAVTDGPDAIASSIASRGGSAYMRISIGSDVPRAAALVESLASRGIAPAVHVLPSALDASAADGSLEDVLAALAEVPGVLITADVDGLALDSWRQIHQRAHAHGIRSMAAMPYFTAGAGDAYAAHLEMVRAIQDETGLFTHCIPIPVEDPTEPASHRALPTALQTLRAIAVARIVLDNIPHISVSPHLVGLEVATLALSHGADTIDTMTGGTRRLSIGHNAAGDAAAASLPVLDSESIETEAGSSELGSRIAEARFRPIAVAADLQSDEVTSVVQHH